MQSKNAIGNLMNRYRAVLKKCHIMNTFGSLAIAGMLVMGSTGMANANQEPPIIVGIGEEKEVVDQSHTDTNIRAVTNNGIITITGKSEFTGNVLPSEGASGAHTHGGVILNSSENYEETYRSIVNISGQTLFSHNATTDNHGGVIYNDTNGIINISGETTFAGNKATSTGSSGYAGGAIYNKYTVNISGTTNFIGNTATAYAGAIANASGATLNINIENDGKTIFSQNSGASYGGGAIYNGVSSTINMKNTVFDENTTTSDTAGFALGGAIYNRGQIIAIDTVFTNNSAKNSGGALASLSGSTSDIENSEFIANSAVNNGGAIYNTGAMNLTDTYFKNNKINGASGTGGAIYNAENGELTITNSTFTGNEVNFYYGYGGAIANTATIKSITGSIFGGNAEGDANKAQNGGTLYNNGSTAIIESISKSSFMSNNAFHDGGAIFNRNGATIASINGVDFINNTATRGGAIFNDDNAHITTISNSRFIGNSTTTRYENNDPTVPTGSEGKGGAIFNVKSTIGSIVNTDFIGNTATQYGGAIVNFSTASIGGISGLFDGNQALYNGDNNVSTYGGAIYNGGTIGKESGVSATFNKNEAGTSGGAIFNYGSGNVYINSSTFTENSAGSSGGAIFNNRTEETNATLTFTGNNIFSGNKAGDTLNDIHNLGYINASGNMTLDGGVTGDGIFTIKEGTNLNLTAGNSTTMENTMNVDGKLTIAGGTLNASDINLKGNLWAGELNITDKSKSFGDLSTGGSLNVSDLDDIKLVGDNYGIYIYDAEYTKEDLETLHSDVNNAAQYVGTLVDENGNVEALDVEVNRGTATIDNGTFATGNTANLGDASTLVGTNSTVKNLTTSADAITLTQETTLVGGSDGALIGNTEGQVANVTVESSATLNIGLAGNTAQAQGGSLGKVTLAGTSKMNVLNASLTMDSLKLGSGSTFFIDPAYVATESLESIEGEMLIGSGSVMSIGGANIDIADIKTEVEKLGFTTTDTSNGGFTVLGSEAVLIAGQAINISSTGHLILDANMVADGSGEITNKPTTSSQAYFADNSLFIVDADIAKGDNVALTGTGTLSVQEGAKLLITDAADGDTINITDGFASGTTDWTVSADSSLLTATGSGNASDYNVTLTKNDVNTVFGNAGLDSELIGMLGNYDGGNSNSFLVKATSTTNIADIKDQAQTIEGAAKLGVAGGAISSAVTVSDTGISNVVNRAGMKDLVVAENNSYLVASNSYATDARPQSKDFGLWAMPMYNHTSSNGFESGNYEYGYDTDIYGVTVGGDYTFANNARLGLAFHVGSGSSDSNGHFASTENDFDYLGASLYTGYTWGNVALSADFGYTSTDNEVEQKSLVGRLNSDFDASVITLGARAEYRFQNSLINATPYLGVRYNYTDVDSYDTKHVGATMSSTESTDSSVLTIPMGIEFSKGIVTDSGYTLSPSAGIGVQIAMGDLDVEQRVGFSGVAGTSGIESEVFDPVTFQGALGLEVAKGDFSFDLDYTIDASSNVTSHGVMGTFRYDF